jgi:small-conductance mechanosensitive channel
MEQPPGPEKNAARFTGNLLLPLLILAVTAVLFVQTLDFLTQEDVGPAAVPRLWMAFLACFGVYLTVQAARRMGKPDPVPGRVRFVLLFVGWLVAYLMAVEEIGYFVSTFVFLVGSMYVLTYRNHVVIFSVSLGWLGFSYLVFYKLLFIPLPVGALLRPLIE